MQTRSQGSSSVCSSCYLGLDPSAVCCRNQLEWANAHIQFCLALCRGVVMVWAGACYGQQKQAHFNDGIVNAERWPITVPFIHNHHLMTQQDDTRPHFERICTQQPAHCTDMSPTECLGCSGSADTTACSCSSNIQQRCTAIEEQWPNIPLQITSLFRRCVALLLNQTNSRY